MCNFISAYRPALEGELKMKKQRWHFLVKINGKYLEGTYGNATFAELKQYIKRYYPQGSGPRKIDLRTLTIVSRGDQ